MADNTGKSNNRTSQYKHDDRYKNYGCDTNSQIIKKLSDSDKLR